jgi:hypothetical protein
MLVLAPIISFASAAEAVAETPSASPAIIMALVKVLYAMIPPLVFRLFAYI